MVLQPQARMIIQPVFPRDQLLAGVAGQSEAEFTVDEEGATREISIISSSHPAFGAALNAAIESWGFKPAQGENGPMAIRLRAAHEFVVPSESPEARLANLLKPGGAGIGGPGGLDRKLSPLWRGFPVYPHALREVKETGGAQIEFVIDRDGRARFPKILSATAEVFGWAAATAVSQWVFEPPMRQGQPVDIVVRVPVNFEPPR
jgi:TonB family protein